MPVHLPLTYNINSTTIILKTLSCLLEVYEKHLGSLLSEYSKNSIKGYTKRLSTETKLAVFSKKTLKRITQIKFHLFIFLGNSF